MNVHVVIYIIKQDVRSWLFLWIHRILKSCLTDLCKQFRPRSGLPKCQASYGSKLFDIDCTLKEFFEKVDFVGGGGGGGGGNQNVMTKKSKQIFPASNS